MLLAEQLVRQRYVRSGPLVLGTAPIKYPAPTTDRDRTVSRRSEPSSRTALIGEQPNPWDRIQPQDAMSRHRGAKPQQQPKEEAANKAKEAPVAEPKAEKAAPKRKVGRPRKDANIAEKAENKEVENAKPIVKPTEEKAVAEKTVVAQIGRAHV